MKKLWEKVSRVGFVVFGIMMFEDSFMLMCLALLMLYIIFVAVVLSSCSDYLLVAKVLTLALRKEGLVDVEELRRL